MLLTVYVYFNLILIKLLLFSLESTSVNQYIFWGQIQHIAPDSSFCLCVFVCVCVCVCVGAKKKPRCWLAVELKYQQTFAHSTLKNSEDCCMLLCMKIPSHQRSNHPDRN